MFKFGIDGGGCSGFQYSFGVAIGQRLNQFHSSYQ